MPSPRWITAPALSAACLAALAGCGAEQEAPAPASPSVSVIDTPSDAPFTDPAIPAPSATLTAPPVPAGTGIATASPTTLPQYVPPDISLSGIALAISSTTPANGQSVQVAAQAAPELAGHTAYLRTGLDNDADTLATTTVGDNGTFTLKYTPTTTSTILVTVAQSDVAPDAPYNADQVVARSDNATITVSP